MKAISYSYQAVSHLVESEISDLFLLKILGLAKLGVVS